MLHPQILAGDDTGYAMSYARREQLVVNAAIEALLHDGVEVVCDDTSERDDPPVSLAVRRAVHSQADEVVMDVECAADV